MQKKEQCDGWFSKTSSDLEIEGNIMKFRIEWVGFTDGCLNFFGTFFLAGFGSYKTAII